MSGSKSSRKAGCLQHIPDRLREWEQDGCILFRVVGDGAFFLSQGFIGSAWFPGSVQPHLDNPG